jgi:hypothetical protein
MAQAPSSTEKAKTPKTNPAAKQQPAVPSLDELLDQALKNNPDVRVAEAKVREAEAELNRIRLQVSQKVISLHHDIATQKAIVEEFTQRYTTQEKLRSTGGTSQEDLRSAYLALEREKAKLAATEAEISSMVGKLPKTVTGSTVRLWNVETGKVIRTVPQLQEGTWVGSVAFSPDGKLLAVESDGTVRVFDARTGAVASAAKQEAVAPPAGSMEHKIRQALNKQITLKIQNASLEDVLKAVQSQVPDVPFHSVVAWGTGDAGKRSFQLGQLPLGAYLEAIQDTFRVNDQVVFIMREYGILVTSEADVPARAVRAVDVWKGKGWGITPGKSTSGSSDQTMAPPGLEGSVKAVDADNGMLTISLGSDAGLRLGHTLEVFHTGPEPKYWGRMQIRALCEREAVGKMISEAFQQSTKKIQVGDRVTSSRTTR